MSPIAVLGAGSWGTALAILMARNGYAVHLWDHNSNQVSNLYHQQCNNRYLPGIVFPPSLEVFAQPADAVAQVEDILIVVPSHAFREVLMLFKPFLAKNIRIAWGTKGVDIASGKFLHEVVTEICGAVPMAMIAGPSFAKEVAIGLPTAITLAHNNIEFAHALIERMRAPNFRVYTTEDMIGAEVCVVVKNVLAIAVGISDGLNLGANARCALITRGLAEMARLGKALGGKQETFMGLAGVGDLVLTATDNQSRNRRLGLALGAGKHLENIEREIGLVEGMTNAAQIYKLAQQLAIEMPITEQVYRVINEKLSPDAAVKALLSRDLKREQI